MQPKNIFILFAHPDSSGGTFSSAVAEAYEKSAREAGHTVRRSNLGDVDFDPILHKGYKEIQELEPGLREIQENIKWANHFVLVYPNWWNTMPALLKGFFDRAWLPGFAFNFEKPSMKLVQRMKGKTARVIILAGTQSPFMTWFKYGDFTNEIEHGILNFAGFKTSVSSFGPCEHCNDAKRASWIKIIEGLGKKGV